MFISPFDLEIIIMRRIGDSGVSRSGVSRGGQTSGSGNPFDYDEDWFSNRYNDDAYMKQIEQYKDKDWYQYLLTNPWLWSKQGTFSPNVWQSISAAFGDMSAENNYINQIQSNQQQWLSDFIEKMRQQEYNSPANQAALEQAAGLNPNLTGISGIGQAAENDQPMLDTPVSGFGSEDLVPKLGSFFMSIYSLASGFAKDMFSFQSMSNQLASEDLELNKQVVSQATEFIKGAIGSPSKVVDESGVESWVFPDLSLDKVEQYAKTNFRSRSARKRFINEVKSSYSSARSNFAKYGIIRDGEQAKVALSNSLGFQAATGSSGGSNLDPIISVSEELNDLAIKTEIYNKNYLKDYYSNASGEAAAKAENATNEGVQQEQETRSYQRGMDKIINSTMERIVKKLEKSAVDGGFNGLLAKGMLLYLSAFRLNMIPSLPKVNLSGMVQNKNFSTNNTTNILE